jgi:hypothetical protein
MSDVRYTLAGWSAIAGVVLVVPLFVLGIVVKALPAVALGVTPPPAAFAVVPLYMMCLVAQTFCMLFALYHLRHLLAERFSFREALGPILAIIVVSAVIAAFMLIARVCYTIGFLSRPGVIAALVLLGMLLIVIGILNIVIALRLLRIGGNPYGLMRPFAYLTMAVGIGCASIVLMPLAGLIDMAGGIVLALIFFRAADSEGDVEFV